MMEVASLTVTPACDTVSSPLFPSSSSSSPLQALKSTKFFQCTELDWVEAGLQVRGGGEGEGRVSASMSLQAGQPAGEVQQHASAKFTELDDFFLCEDAVIELCEERSPVRGGNEKP